VRLVLVNNLNAYYGLRFAGQPTGVWVVFEEPLACLGTRFAVDAGAQLAGTLRNSCNPYTLRDSFRFRHFGYAQGVQKVDCCRSCHLILFSPYICLSLSAHAALFAHRLGCVDDAVVGLLITAVSDLQTEALCVCLRLNASLTTVMEWVLLWADCMAHE